MRKLSTYLKKAGISLMAAFTVFTNTNMGTLIAKAAEPQLNEGEELYQITEGENTYTIREYTMDNSEVLFALRPETTHSADDQYEAYADDGIESYLNDNDVSTEQSEAVRKIISIGYGMEPNVGNYIASQVLIWQVVTGNTYEVDENVAANMEALQTKILEYDVDPEFAGQDVSLEGYGEDHAVTLEDGSFTGYTEKKIPEGYHVEINDGSLKLWADEGTEAGTLTFEKKSSEMKSILYKGTNGEFLSLGMEPKEIRVNAKIDVPETVEEPKDEKVDEKTEESEEAKAEAKLEKGLKAAKAAKAPVNNESVVAESVGDVRLVDISDVHVDYLKADNTTMTEGETFQTTSSSLSFSGRLEWTIPNSVDLRNVERVTYQLPKNVTLKTLSGDVTFRGDTVGTYEIDQDNLLYITYNDAFKEESNRAGWFKFETENVENKSEEQGLLFESGEEYSFRKKDPDPPAPVTPKIGIEKEYVRFKEGDAPTYRSGSNIPDLNNSDIYKVSVYTADGTNNNVIIDDSYTTTKGGTYSCKYAYITIINGSRTKLSAYVELSGKSDDYVIDESTGSEDKNVLEWLNGFGSDKKTFFYRSGDYVIGSAIKNSDAGSKLPSFYINQLKSGDAVKIYYYTFDMNSGATTMFGNKTENTATVVSDENPTVDKDKRYTFPESYRKYLSQTDTVTVFNDASELLDKTATSEEDTVHCEITVNGKHDDQYYSNQYAAGYSKSESPGRINHFYGWILEILAHTYDNAQNFSLEPSDDADYYLDKDSVKIECSYLEFNSNTGVYERKTMPCGSYANNPNMFNNFFLGKVPFITLINDQSSFGNTYMISPIITLSYDLKLNPSKIKYSSCEKIEYAGSNTLMVDSNSSFFVDPDGNDINDFKKTVNYTNSLLPPKVEKSFQRIINEKKNEEQEITRLFWDLNVYIPNTGVTNLVVSDILSNSFSFDEEFSRNYPTYEYINGVAIIEDETSHENPITTEVTRNESGKQVVKLKIDGKVNPDTGNYIKMRLAFKVGDYTLDPNYRAIQEDEQKIPIEIRFTNHADIDADEIENPCVKCPGCGEGECTKIVETKNAVNKSFKGYTDNTENGGDLVITWRIVSSISRLLKDSDEITFEDFSPTTNLKFNEETLNRNVTISSNKFDFDQVGYDRKSEDSSISDEDILIKFSDFFDITHDGNKTTLKVKPEYVSQIKGKQIKFDYVTTATKIASYTDMKYTNHVDMLVNGTKESEGEDDYSIKAKKDNSFQKTAMSAEEFFNTFDPGRMNAGVFEGVLYDQMHSGYQAVNKDDKNLVVWKMEVDTTKLSINEDTQSIKITDLLPNNVPSKIKRETFGIMIATESAYDVEGLEYHRIKMVNGNPEIDQKYLMGYIGAFEISLEASQNTVSTTLKNRAYPNLKYAINHNYLSKFTVYIFERYTPRDNNNNQTTTLELVNNADLYVDNNLTSKDSATYEAPIEPSIKKSVVYDKDTAPYAEYTVQITFHDHVGSWFINEPIIIEDLPSSNLEILRESLYFELDLKSWQDSRNNKVIKYNYDSENDYWRAQTSSWNGRPVLTTPFSDISIENGKLLMITSTHTPTSTQHVFIGRSEKKIV